MPGDYDAFGSRSPSRNRGNDCGRGIVAVHDIRPATLQRAVKTTRTTGRTRPVQDYFKTIAAEFFSQRSQAIETMHRGLVALMPLPATEQADDLLRPAHLKAVRHVNNFHGAMFCKFASGRGQGFWIDRSSSAPILSNRLSSEREVKVDPREPGRRKLKNGILCQSALTR